MSRFTVSDFHARYPDEDACLEVVKDMTYDGCECGREKLYRVKSRRAYACACGKQFFPLSGTIFEGSQTPLTTWFYAMYLMSVTKSGISAAQLQRMTGVTYKCAWRMMHKIRELMAEDEPLTGEIEADETYLRAKPWRTTRPLAYNGRAQTVFGMVERGGRAKALAIPTNSKHYLLTSIKKHTKDVSTFYTDGLPAYQDLGITHPHYIVQHSKEEYVRENVHTNNIENFWGGVKRGVYGVYRSVSPEHIQKYLDQYSWIYSHRHSTRPLFDVLLEKV